MLDLQPSLNYIIIKTCWALCSSRVESSPITLSSKNMGPVTAQRIKSIWWSNLKQCFSNKAGSNGKIKPLSVQHYSSGLVNGALSRHDNSIERESNCHGNRSPWAGVAYLCLNLLQPIGPGNFKLCHDCHAVGFMKLDRSVVRSSKVWQIMGSTRTSSPVGTNSFLQSICVSQQLSCDPNSRTIFLLGSAADDWPPYDKIRGFDWQPDHFFMFRYAFTFSVSPVSILTAKCNISESLCFLSLPVTKIKW